MGIYASKVKPLTRTERCQQTKSRNEARKIEQIARDKAIAEARAKRGDIGQLYQLDKLGLTAKKERSKIQARLDKAKEEVVKVKETIKKEEPKKKYQKQKKS